MRIAFSRTPTLFSVGVRVVTQDEGYDVANGFSHAALVFPDNTVLDSRALAGGITPPRPLANYLASHPDSVFVDLNLPTEESAARFAHDQIGKKYDNTALAAFLAPAWMTGRRNWQDDDRWFCSEFVGAALVHGGLHFDIPQQFLSPNGLARRLGVPACNRPGLSCAVTKR